MPLVITLLVPLLVMVLGSLVGVPGLEAPSGVPPHRVGVFAVPLTTYASMFVLVEIACAVVPAWRPLRIAPRGRARLARIAGMLGLLFAGIACLGLAQTLGTFAVEPGMRSRALIFVTLLGGVSVQLIGVRLIDRHGLGHGLVVMLAAAVLQELLGDLAPRLGVSSPARALASTPLNGLGVLGTLAGMTAVIGATGWLLNRADLPEASEHEASSPYRGSSARPLRVVAPLPVSSFAPLALTHSVLGSAAALVWSARIDPASPSSPSYLAASIVCTVLLTLLLARWLHRPADTQALRAKLRGLSDAEYTPLLAASARAGIAPTLAYFGVLILAGLTGAPSPVLVATLVPVVLDIARAARLPATWVVVAAEPRLDGVPILRAALRAEGIVSETRGAHVAAFWQLFAPYAPTQILVSEADRPRAIALLAQWRDPDAPTTAAAPTVSLGPSKPTAQLHWLVLVGCALLPVVGWMLGRQPAPTIDRSVPAAQLALARIDDDADPFGSLDEAALPASIRINREDVPTAQGRSHRRFATSVVAREADLDAARAEFEAWLLEHVQLPAGKRFGFGIVDQIDVAGEVERIGWRTYVFTGTSPIVVDVLSATVPPPDPDAGRYAVRVTMRAEAARQIADFTRPWVKRRVAMLLDGRVQAAPLLLTALDGGTITLPLRDAPPKQQKAEAARMASALSPR